MGVGGVGTSVGLGGVLGSLSPDKLNTSPHACCSNESSKQRGTTATQRQAEIISLFKAILGK